MNLCTFTFLPDVIDLIVVEINFKDDRELAERCLWQFGDIVALQKI
jgi:hypothetical protein